MAMLIKRSVVSLNEIFESLTTPESIHKDGGFLGSQSPEFGDAHSFLFLKGGTGWLNLAGKCGEVALQQKVKFDEIND
jgi:hypothetical protein